MQQLPWQLLVSCGALKAHVYLLETTAYSIFLLNHLQAPASPASRSEISWQSRSPHGTGQCLCSSAALYQVAFPSLTCSLPFSRAAQSLPGLSVPVPGAGRGCWHRLVLGDPRPGHATTTFIPDSFYGFQAEGYEAQHAPEAIWACWGRGSGLGTWGVTLQCPPSLAGDTWLCGVRARGRGAARRPSPARRKAQ